MRNLPKIFLSWCVALFVCATQAQVRPVRIRPAIPTPPPTAPTSRTFLSANRKFKLILEEATLAPVSGPRNVALNASIVEEAGNNLITVWATSFDGNPVRNYSDDDVIVSDEGDFFVLMKMSGGDVSLFTKNFQKSLNTTARFSGLNAGLFLTPPERLVAADVLNGQKIIRIWLRNENLWEAFRVSDGAKISITPPIAAQWNEATRDKVLDLMYADKREKLRQRVGGISGPLARLSRVGGGTNASPVRDIHYEFITQQRRPEDRHWVEELAFGDNGVNSQIGSGFSATMFWPFTGQYTFTESDYARLRGDWLLAIWDKKLTNGMRAMAGETDIDMPRFYLGKVSGRVRLPVPLNVYPTTKSTILHVHLTKEGAKDSAEHLTAMIVPAAQSREIEVMQDVWFKFGTVLPGTYRLKAVWDKRAPFANPDTPGPGDYEGVLSTAVVVTAGANISNVVVNCTNRARGGEAYYSADQWLADNWRSGKIARFTYASDSEGRVDILTRPASDWIFQTNSFDAKAGVEIATIGLRTPKNVPGEELQHGNELVVALRRTTHWSRQFLGPPELIVKDEHGCPYPAKAVRDGDLITYTFWNFPRSAATWRIIAQSQKDDGQARRAFDVTVKNLVQTPPQRLPIRPLPAELNLGEVTMKIAFAGLEFRSPSVAATFFVDEKENTDWQITEARVVDVHGNFMGTREMCSAEESVILIGRVGKGSRPTKTLPFAIGVARDADPPATGSASSSR